MFHITTHFNNQDTRSLPFFTARAQTYFFTRIELFRRAFANNGRGHTKILFDFRKSFLGWPCLGSAVGRFPDCIDSRVKLLVCERETPDSPLMHGFYL